MPFFHAGVEIQTNWCSISVTISSYEYTAGIFQRAKYVHYSWAIALCRHLFFGSYFLSSSDASKDSLSRRSMTLSGV